MERKICLGKMCYLHEIHLLLPTLDFLLDQEASLFKVRHIEKILIEK